MRPVRLVMQAFGPYAGRQEVDFREAVEAGLFGIYGQTGSGKSTIFSAITFALFGEASRAEQDTRSLRSDHADPALLTEVEFIFDIGAKRYVLRRRPEQSRPKQRGTGETGMLHEAWLFDATGKTIEDISEADSGKPLAERKTGVVLDTVTGLLGYGAKQFRQIVLLPQGRFEAFLAADTSDRLKILRDLFDVSLYARLAARLKADAAEAERTVREQRMICEARLQAEGFDGLEALRNGIAEAQTLCATRLAQETEKRAALDEARKALEAAQATEKRFRDAAEAEATLAALKAKAELMATVEDRVKTALRAEKLADVEANALKAATDLSESRKRVAEAQTKVEAATQAAATAAARLNAERARIPETEAMRRDIDALERHRETLQASEALKTAALAQEAAHRATLTTWEATRHELDRLSDLKRRTDERLLVVQANEARRQTLIQQKAELETRLKMAQAHERASRDVIAAQEEQNQAAAALLAARQTCHEAEAAFLQAEAAMSKAQALHLAARLEPGAPCPVCGALDHPAPARGDISHSGLDAAFRAARSALEAARQNEAAASGHLAARTATLEERQRLLAGLESPAQPAETLLTELGDIRKELTALGEPVDLDKAKRVTEAMAPQLEAASQAMETARAAHEEARIAAITARTRLEAALATVPEDVRAPDALMVRLATVERKHLAHKQAFDAAEQVEREARDAVITVTETHRTAVAEEVRAVDRAAAELRTFMDRLASEGMSEAEYHAAKPLIAGKAEDQARLDEHRRALAIAEARLSETREALNNLERPDLAQFEALLLQANVAFEDAVKTLADARSNLSKLNRLQNELAESFAALEAADAATGPLRTLAALFNADNGQRLDLETYAIGAMFDLVLAAANQRLEPMTRGRYLLERENEGGGRARRGLGIRVFDLHTGKSRPTATLSGGETFIAALSLALGLADVVESASGKVRLDTVFIDEGFGSLDTENGTGTLEQVLQVLSALAGTSRAIGLISHVPLVQEAVPNGFYVHRHAGGSVIESRATP